MHITLNGRPKDIADRINLKALIEQVYDTQKPVVAEINGAIIKKQDWSTHSITKDDVIELVNFVGGG